jgi:hypothetical protein
MGGLGLIWPSFVLGRPAYKRSIWPDHGDRRCNQPQTKGFLPWPGAEVYWPLVQGLFAKSLQGFRVYWPHLPSVDSGASADRQTPRSLCMSVIEPCVSTNVSTNAAQAHA